MTLRNYGDERGSAAGRANESVPDTKQAGVGLVGLRAERCMLHIKVIDPMSVRSRHSVIGHRLQRIAALSQSKAV